MIEDPDLDAPGLDPGLFNRASLIDVDAGTSEETWRSWAWLLRVEPLAWEPPGPVVVVAPHPDDEVLALGGTLRRWSAQGLPVTLVAVTDGEASHPGSESVSPDELRRIRPLESAAALADLQVRLVAEHRLGVPDGSVATYEEGLYRQLVDLARGHALVAAPWSLDGHPDHDASGRAAERATEELGCRFLQYPVWMWNWSIPRDPRVPWSSARRVGLDPADRSAKARAMAAFATQVRPAEGTGPATPVLPPSMISHFERPYEIVFV